MLLLVNPISWAYIGTPSFFSINHNGHLVTYEFDLRPHPIPVPTNQSNTTTSEGDHHTTHLSTLPILNPFKSIMSRSTEHLPLNGNNNHTIDGGKTILANPYDVGILLTNLNLAGLSLRHRQDGRYYGLAWAQRQLTVRLGPFCYFLILICLSCLSIGNSRWGSSLICLLLTLGMLGGWIMIAMQFLLRYLITPSSRVPRLSIKTGASRSISDKAWQWRWS